MELNHVERRIELIEKYNREKDIEVCIESLEKSIEHLEKLKQEQGGNE